MHSLPSRIVLVVLVSICSQGCNDIKNLTMDLDGSRDATFDFWVTLQRIQYDGNPELVQRYGGFVSAAQSGGDLESQFSSIASKHAHMARQLKDLNASKVDPVAIEYRDRLVDSHEELAKLLESGDFMWDRGAGKLASDNYLATWDDRYNVMSELNAKFDWEFDYVK